VALIGIARQTLGERGFQRIREWHAGDCRHARWVFHDLHGQNLDRVRSHERRATGDQLERDARERVDVGTSIGLRALDHLRRKIGRRAEHRSLRSQARSRG
jgi:hypothetical protein